MYHRLQNRQQEWGTKVKLLFGDMRFIDIPEKADILVSELLGSFGDNELSPECLDGASRFLKSTFKCLKKKKKTHRSWRSTRHFHSILLYCASSAFILV